MPDTSRPKDRTAVGALSGRVGRVVRVCGWLEVVPAGAETGHPEVALADHTGAAPLLLTGPDAPTPGSAVEAVGEAVPAAGQSGGAALAVHHLSVLGPADAGLPVDESSSLAERLDWRYLDLRRPETRLIFRVQTALERAMRDAWADGGFVELHTPKLMATAPRPEELFRLSYFERRAWLAQSPQFYKQMAMAAGLDRVFEIGPVFRAEHALSPVHATEFTSVDVEMAWIDSHEDVMAFAEAWLSRAVGEVAARHGEDIADLLGTRVEAPTAPFPRITLAEAWDVVTGAGHAGADGDLDRAGERLLSRYVAEKHGHQLVWITDYPEPTRPFYHMRSADGSLLTRSFDLLWNGVEVASGAQREHRHDRLLAQARSRRVPLEPIRNYLDFFRYGCPPHGGFGFGLNRLLMCLLGIHDIREVTFLPRDRERLAP